jgi:3-polyprenyl-4-hydroxybenzoate decarboxylase
MNITENIEANGYEIHNVGKLTLRHNRANQEALFTWLGATDGTDVNEVLAAIIVRLQKTGTAQVITAGAGQTDFTTILPCDSRTLAEVAGSVYSVGTGISITGANTVHFDSLVFVGGESVVIRQF